MDLAKDQHCASRAPLLKANNDLGRAGSSMDRYRAELRHGYQAAREDGDSFVTPAGEGQSAQRRSGLLRKLLITLGSGLTTFLLTQLTDPGLVWSVAATVFVAGVAFVAQFLFDVERRLEAAEAAQRQGTRDIKEQVDERFGKVVLAAELFSQLEASGLQGANVEQLVRHAAKIGSNTPPLVTGFVDAEISRLSDVLHRLGTDQHVDYEGEDRDWLRGLAQNAAESIDATSLSTVDERGRGFVDGGLWRSDLGLRYLDDQLDALRRGVVIRRIFIVDRPAVARDSNFLEVCHKHQSLGVKVRILDLSGVSVAATSIVDFIVFDGKVAYETTAASTTSAEGSRPPQIVRTRLSRKAKFVEGYRDRFLELWRLAVDLPPVSPDPLPTRNGLLPADYDFREATAPQPPSP